MGMGISKPVTPSSVPGAAGAASSSFATESMGQGAPKVITDFRDGSK